MRQLRGLNVVTLSQIRAVVTGRGLEKNVVESPLSGIPALTAQRATEQRPDTNTAPSEVRPLPTNIRR
jgi:hypothetical protein